jgi:hypothetical protein
MRRYRILRGRMRTMSLCSAGVAAADDPAAEQAGARQVTQSSLQGFGTAQPVSR